MCPVGTFKLYLEKLCKARNDLWQKPKRKVRGTEEEWFQNQVVGRDPLNNIMKQISKDAKLSNIYTNHSIRSTCLTRLDEAGFEIRHIQAVSGHKSEDSIRAYSKKCPENKKREMAAALDIPTIMPKRAKPTEAMSKPPEEIVDFIPIEDNIADFDLGNILDEIEKEEKKQNPPNSNVVAVTTGPVESDNMSENALVPSQTQNVVNNVTNTNMQTHPFLPKMVFNNSSVTINYNFSK